MRAMLVGPSGSGKDIIVLGLNNLSNGLSDVAEVFSDADVAALSAALEAAIGRNTQQL